MKITSVNNELVKETAKLLIKKYREDMFLLEGKKCIEEALESGLEIVRIFTLEGSKEFENFADRIETTEQVMAKISSTETPPKSVAAAKKPRTSFSKDFKRVLLLENIKDAGNLGTILRAACAFDIDAVILYGDTVDLYNPKCVRSSAGNLWKIPVFETEDLSIFDEYERIATLPRGENTVSLQNYTPDNGKVLIMFGAEADGLSEKLKNFATKKVTVEMSEKNMVESLNLSIAAGIVLYQIFVR